MVLWGELPPTSCQLQNHEHVAGSALESASKEPSLLEKQQQQHGWELAEIFRIIIDYISNNQIDPVDRSLS